MRLFSVFGIGRQKILSTGCRTCGTVTKVEKSCLYVIKKPVRLYVSNSNTLFSHYITFSYCVDSLPYTGKLFIDPNHRCPQTGASIDVYYDPENPQKYACYSFGPAVRPIGW